MIKILASALWLKCLLRHLNGLRFTSTSDGDGCSTSSSASIGRCSHGDSSIGTFTLAADRRHGEPLGITEYFPVGIGSDGERFFFFTSLCKDHAFRSICSKRSADNHFRVLLHRTRVSTTKYVALDIGTVLDVHLCPYSIREGLAQFRITTACTINFTAIVCLVVIMCTNGACNVHSVERLLTYTMTFSSIAFTIWQIVL